MSGIYWLASYPKSGNTWLRALLTNYRFGGHEPVSINALDGGWTASLRETFDEYVGVESGWLTREVIDDYRRIVHEAMAAMSPDPLWLKVHDAYTCTSEGLPMFPAAATAGVIYLVRHPMDVAVSYAHHLDQPLDETIRLMAHDDAMLGGAGRPGRLLPQHLGSWSGHVRSWTEQTELRVHVVRYEDLLRDTVAVFTDVLRFAGVVADSRCVERAVECSRFEHLQAQEVATGFAEKQPTASSFFRAGRAGSWQGQLSTAQVRRLTAAHGEVMRRFGYLPDGRGE